MGAVRGGRSRGRSPTGGRQRVALDPATIAENPRQGDDRSPQIGRGRGRGVGSGRSWLERIAHRFEAAMAWARFTFITRWGALERGYRRHYAKLALRLKFAFYPLLAIAALAWLGWDWSHAGNQIGRASGREGVCQYG